MGDDLDKRIAEAQAKLDAQSRPRGQSTGKGMGQGFKMASEFSAAIIVGLVLGLGIDAMAHTSPWATIVCMFLGFAAGVRNVVATASAANKAAALDGQAGKAPPDGPKAGKGEGA